MSLLLFAEGTANLSEQNKMSKCKTDDFLPKFIRCSHKDFTANPRHGSSDRLFKERKKKRKPKPHTNGIKKQRKEKKKKKQSLTCPCLVHLWCISSSRICSSLTNHSPEEIHFSLSTRQSNIFHRVYKITIKFKEKRLYWYYLVWAASRLPI